MVEVIKIAGSMIIGPVLSVATIKNMFSLEIISLPLYHLLEIKCLYHTNTMKMNLLARDFLLHLHLVQINKFYLFLKLLDIIFLLFKKITHAIMHLT